MASSGIRPRSIVRPGTDYERPKVFGRPRPTGDSNNGSDIPTATAPNTSSSPEIGSRIKRTFGLNKPATMPSKIVSSPSSPSRTSIPERTKAKTVIGPKRLTRPTPISPRSTVEPLDTEQLQGSTSRVSRFDRPSPIGQKSGLRIADEPVVSSHQRSQSMADNNPTSASVLPSKELKNGRFGRGPKQPSLPISANNKKASVPAKNMVDAIDTDDEFDVDRLVDDLRQKTTHANETAINPTGTATTAREISRHRRHHSVMGSASIAGDVRAGWSAAASAALERARLRAAGATTEQKSATKAPTFQRNGSRSVSSSIEEYRASQSVTPVSTPPSRQSNTPSQQQKDRLTLSLPRRADSDDSVPTLSSNASNNDPSPSGTTAVESQPSADSLSRPPLNSSLISLTEESKVITAGMTASPTRSSLIINGQAVSEVNIDRLINVGQQNTYQSLIGAIKEQQTPPLQQAKRVNSDVISDTVSEHSNSTIRADWLARARARGGSTVEPEQTAAAVERHHRRRSSLLDEKYFSADDTRTASATEEEYEGEEEETVATNIKKPLKNKILSNLPPGSYSPSSSSASSLVVTATHVDNNMFDARMVRKVSSSSITSNMLANATIIEEDHIDSRENVLANNERLVSLRRSTSLRHERLSRTNPIHITSSFAHTSLEQQRPLNNSIDDVVQATLNEEDYDSAGHSGASASSTPSFLDSQRCIRRLSLHQSPYSTSAISRFRRSDPDHMASSLPSIPHSSANGNVNSFITQRSALPSQWTRINHDNNEAISTPTRTSMVDDTDRNAAVDQILQAIDADDDSHDNNDDEMDPLRRKRAVRGALRTLNGKIADDSSTDADSPRLSVRTSIEGLRPPRGVMSRPIIGSAKKRSAHARSMSDFPDSVFSGDYTAVRGFLETRAGASTADGYAYSVSTNDNIAASIRDRSYVSAVTTPATATSSYRIHRMERTRSLTSANSIERFNSMNLVSDEGSTTIGARLQRSTSRRSRNNNSNNDDASDHSSSGHTSLLATSRQGNHAYIESGDVDGVCTRSQKLLIRAQQEFCMTRQTSNLLNNQQDTNLPTGFAVSPRLSPVVLSINDATQQYLNPNSAHGRLAGPSVESRLDEVVESSIRLDRILRQVSADLRRGRTTEASQAVLELWRDSEQVVRGLTDVLLGLSAGVPRSRSPAIAPTNDSPRGTPTRAYRTSTATTASSSSIATGMTGRVSASGRNVPTPLQLPTPVSDHEPTLTNDEGLTQLQYRPESASSATVDISDPPKSAAAIASSGSIRRQRALSQLISPTARTGAFFAAAKTPTATTNNGVATTSTTATSPSTATRQSIASIKNGISHTRARTITSSITNDSINGNSHNYDDNLHHPTGLGSIRTLPSLSKYDDTNMLSKLDTTTWRSSNYHNNNNYTTTRSTTMDAIHSPSLIGRRF